MSSDSVGDASELPIAMLGLHATPRRWDQNAIIFDHPEISAKDDREQTRYVERPAASSHLRSAEVTIWEPSDGGSYLFLRAWVPAPDFAAALRRRSVTSVQSSMCLAEVVKV